ncbi:MAG TPA: glycoside hydrolase family 15 protein [Ktedonobacteraceae bacterium]|jgi:GH15 family glucan-1,4-alpha-glucosidase
MTHTKRDNAVPGKRWPHFSRSKDEIILDSPVSGAYQPINAYGMLGNCYSAMLVGLDGSVDWGCLPDFDSPAIFCRLLDAERGGYFQISPVDLSIPGVQSYIPGSNVLQTRFSSLSGEVVLTDFMPVATLDPLVSQSREERSPTRCLVRHLTCSHGQLPVRMVLKVTPRYAMATAEVTLLAAHTGAVICGGQQYTGLCIGGAEHLPAFELHLEQDSSDGSVLLVAQGVLAKGEELVFTLGSCESMLEAYQFVEHESPLRDGGALLAQTLDSWHRWLAKCTYHGPYLEEVHRSALTLKMMTYLPTGALVAAPTTSLPEALGQGRNWDYRYTWLRDASFTLAALSRIGFTEETLAFARWFCTLSWTESAGPQIMYGIRGECELPEYELEHLSGYCGSAPVRVGNRAACQKQLDIFGEVLDCFALFQQFARLELSGESQSDVLWEKLSQLVEYVCAHWQETDSGIWEVRGAPRHNVYSKAMCWVAVDRGVQLAERFEKAVDLPRWRLIRDQIRLDVLSHGYSSQARAFTQSYGSDALDAANLFLPLVGFVAADDPRMISTVDRILADLTDEHQFVYRYHTDDGLSGTEGTFLMCTFWLADNLALQGRLAEARTIFERALRCAGKLGLFSEEVEPANNQALGNYPQAFSHLALIQSALSLQQAEMRLVQPETIAPLIAAGAQES